MLTELSIGPGLFASIILVVMAVELSVIWLYHRITKQGIKPSHALVNLAAGGAIVLAMGLLIEGAAIHWVALALVFSLLAHCVDMAQRWNVHLTEK